MLSRGSWMESWVSLLLAGLLYASVVLRSVLTYRESSVLLPVMALLAAWAVLFVTEPTLSSRWRASFHVYVALQSALTFHLLTRPDLPSFEFYALLFAPLSMQILPKVSFGLSATWLGLFAILMLIPLLEKYGVGEAFAFTLVFSAVNILLGFYALAVSRSREARLRNQALALQLEEANRKVLEASTRLEQLATVRERHRLARELHDSVTQTVFSMTLATQSALLMIEREPEHVGPQLRQLSQLARDALSQMQQLITELRPESIPSDGLAAALRQHIATRPLPDGLSVSVEVDGDMPLGSDEEHGLFSIAREAINNIVKHARASRAVISLRLVDPPAMEIIDDGQGFDAASGVARRGVGLAGMRERAAEIGWNLELTSTPGAGTHLRVARQSAGGRAR